VKTTFLFTSVIFYKIGVQIIKLSKCFIANSKRKSNLKLHCRSAAQNLKNSKEKINPMPELTADARRARRAN
jgi:hypothetical protein